MSIHKTLILVKTFLETSTGLLLTLGFSLMFGISLGVLGIQSISFRQNASYQIIYPDFVPVDAQLLCDTETRDMHAREEGVQESFVASKNGAKYYPMGCTAISRIKEENKVWFSSEEEAQIAGYERSSSC